MIQNTINLADSTQITPASRGKGTRSSSVPIIAQVTSTLEPPAHDMRSQPVTMLDRAHGILLVVVLPSVVWFGAVWAAARLMGYQPGAFGLTALAASLISLLAVIYSSLNIDRS
jgi:hypothetical protein